MASEAIKKAAYEAAAKRKANESENKKETASQVEAAESKAKARVKAKHDAEEAANKRKIVTKRELAEKKEAAHKAAKEKAQKERKSKRKAKELRDKAEAQSKEVAKKKRSSEVQTKVEGKWMAEASFKESHNKNGGKKQKYEVVPLKKKAAPKPQPHHAAKTGGGCVMCQPFEKTKQRCQLRKLSEGFKAGPAFTRNDADHSGDEASYELIHHPICDCPQLTCKSEGRCQVMGKIFKRDSKGLCARK